MYTSPPNKKIYAPDLPHLFSDNNYYNYKLGSHTDVVCNYL
uniref:Uncharacterized protein n=1 Tax=Candidatus Kentrum sp. FM TaxID=2126340 RepID=A0A450U240_9GAMM|nr:MAG: hypothetical protein BECKFM1743A_GA0114220_108133 [Candidatus Kentron sp. FM]VFJ76881.1 MAG: hypothetical protein BECKFM1743C_GA0114222_109513 [Candidatus Kentron sp. FM]VFK22337.1 MAG: hypothetical protein BECKFM1743B_GA0114221_108531 [Candidatus Kentron sp. FM]